MGLTQSQSLGEYKNEEEKWINDNINKITVFLQDKIETNVINTIKYGAVRIFIINKNSIIPGVNGDFPLSRERYLKIMRRIDDENRLKAPRSLKLKFEHEYYEDIGKFDCCSDHVEDIQLYVEL